MQTRVSNRDLIRPAQAVKGSALPLPTRRPKGTRHRLRDAGPACAVRQPLPLVLLVSVGVLLATGCAHHDRPIFDERRPELTWPPAPTPARIRYVGQLRCAADLKPAPKPFQRVGELLGDDTIGH